MANIASIHVIDWFECGSKEERHGKGGLHTVLEALLMTQSRVNVGDAWARS